MSVKEVASTALKSFDEGVYFQNLRKYRSREYFALVGLLQGVADGTITSGQGWVAELLMARQIASDSFTVPKYDVSEKEAASLKAVFGSGICCEGQLLTPERKRVPLRDR